LLTVLLVVVKRKKGCGLQLWTGKLLGRWFFFLSLCFPSALFIYFLLLFLVLWSSRPLFFDCFSFLPSSLFLVLSKCSPFCLLNFFKKNLSLSKTPLFFYPKKKNLCSSLFPINNLLIPLLVRLYFPFFSLFFLFIFTKKNLLLLFFSFWFSLCIYGKQGKMATLPYPSTG